MDTDRHDLKLPEVDWKTGTCPVCGSMFQYLTKTKPRTCRDGECRFKFHYQIDREHWADFQPSFFDQQK